VYPGGEQWEQVRKRKFPVVGDGIWSLVHIADAAEATAIAVDRGRGGIYNIVDDDPAPVADWLPALAEKIGAPKPWRVPKFIGRLAAGEVGIVMMTEIRGASNAKAKRETQSSTPKSSRISGRFRTSPPSCVLQREGDPPGARARLLGPEREIRA
jgi:nucleoside-diphosphate-sugar epimerase